MTGFPIQPDDTRCGAAAGGPGAAPAALQWHRAVAATQVPLEDVIRIEVGEQAFALYNVAGRFYASDDACTHQRARLSDGFVIDNVIECPRHQGRFCIANGKALGPPVSRSLKTYPTNVVDGVIFIGVEPAGA